MTMPPPYQPYTPSYPTMNPTASSFNYQQPTQGLESILGGLKGTGSDFGLPWAPGYTKQPGITTPMVAQPGVPTTGPVGPLNPGGFNPRPYGPPPVTPQPPVMPPPAGGVGGVQGLQDQSSLLFHNNLRSKFGLPPLTPGTPQYQQWLMNQQRNGGMPAWAGPAERSGGGIAGGRGGYPGGGGGSFAGGSHGGDIGAGTHGGHPTY